MVKTLRIIKPLAIWAVERRDNMQEDKNKRGTEYKTGEMDFNPTESYSRCLRCHRALKTKKAMRTGYGHICASKIRKEEKELGQHGEEIREYPEEEAKGFLQ